MPLAILTTDTTHHSYFVREIAKRWDVVLCLIETLSMWAPYHTAHAFEAERVGHERRLWDASGFWVSPRLCQSVNDFAGLSAIREARPSVAVVFGTGKVGPEVIASVPHILNLHGGDPQRFRGLDSHLWSILCDEFPPFPVTLHKLTPALDAGDIVGMRSVPVHAGMKLHQLRGYVTEACVALVNSALEEFEKTGTFESRPQETVGVYFHAMPSWLKERAVRKFEAYTEAL